MNHWSIAHDHDFGVSMNRGMKLMYTNRCYAAHSMEVNTSRLRGFPDWSVQADTSCVLWLWVFPCSNKLNVG